MLARATSLAVAASFGAFALWACGPYFPQWLLTDESRILEAPTTWLKDALEPPLSLSRRPKLKAVMDKRGPYRQTADADLRDLETAISDRNLTARYAEVRDRLTEHGETVFSWRQEAAWSSNPPPPPELPDLTVPAGLPGEIEDYLRGAIAYHQGRLGTARASWERLLDRSPGERRHRSAWAAYMLGRSNLGQDPEAAVRWFESTRELVSQGFPDPLGLAVASLGWQARAEWNRKRPAETLVLYLRQFRAGDPTALQSIRLTGAKLLNDPQLLKTVAGSDDARPVMTAYVLSRWDQVDGSLNPAPARKWLEAIKAVQPRNVSDADRLAWVCYRAGDFAAAEEWLKRAPDSSSMTHWIGAKLLMRAGKLTEAERLLSRYRWRLPRDPGPDHDSFEAYESQLQPALSPRYEGDVGATQLARGDYQGALFSLLNGGYWTDAAYIAERVFTTDELRTHVDEGWPVALASHRPDGYSDGWRLPYAGIVTPDRERMAYDLRYLVGRRLAREGRYTEAEKFLPTSLRVPLKMLARSAAEGQDVQRPAEERARALFRAACVTRYQGLELLSTEIEPDWFVYEGQYENESFAKARLGGKLNRLGPTPDERQRVAQTQVKPAKRFHYRYQGADLARTAADLLPDGSIEKARMLATAGNWLEGRDPEAARPFFDALVSCCGETNLGLRARRLNAIPDTDTCERVTKPAGEDR